MRALVFRAGERGLLAVALVCIGALAMAQARAQLFTAREGRRLASLLGEGSTARGPMRAREAGRARAAAGAGHAWGRLELPRLGLSALVAEGVDASTLSVAAGHFPRTAFPGERGNVALAGHRDTFFRALEHVRRNDVVRLATPDGIFEYRVEWRAVVDPTRTEVVAATHEPHLTLVTCYPFTFLGRAPLRYVVRARQTDSSGATPARS